MLWNLKFLIFISIVSTPSLSSEQSNSEDTFNQRQKTLRSAGLLNVIQKNPPANKYTKLVSNKYHAVTCEDLYCMILKGSPDPSHFIFEINVGKSQIRHRTTLNWNDAIFNRFWVDLEIQFLSRSMSDPPVSVIYFKNKTAWVWATFQPNVLRL